MSSSSSVAPTPFRLPLPPGGRIRKIIHLSDLHIRTGDPSQCRFAEYETVFARTIDRVRALADDETVVVLTGDLFHNKSKVEAPGIVLFYGFVTGLARLVPVYIIQGNHDYRQDQHDTPDLIGALLHERTLENVCYMEGTGRYVAGDVGFGLVSVRETLVAGDTSGQVADLPAFPDPSGFPEGVATKVALFHGTINNCTLQNYTKSPTGYPIRWFEGYDIACLGDVHLRQVHTTNDGMSWGYPGSLIQQDFGEPIIDHGMLVWNIGDKTVSAKNVANDHGFLKVKEVGRDGEGNGSGEGTGGSWLARYKNAWIPLEELLAKAMCPRVLSVRVVQTNGDGNGNTTLGRGGGGGGDEYLRKTLREHGKEATITHYIHDGACGQRGEVGDGNDGNGGNDGFDVSCYNSPLTWEQYIEEKGDPELLRTTDWKLWLRHPETLCIPASPEDVPTEELRSIIADRNSKLTKQIEAYARATDVSNSVKATVWLKYLEWSWMLCFRDTNWFNFETLGGEMASINARNGYGKSSFLEVLCLALYGHTIPSRYSKEHSVSVVCQQRPPKTNGKTVVQFAMDGIVYVLKRTYSPVSKFPSKLLVSEVELCRCEDKGSGSEYTMVHSGKSAVDAWIAKHLGTLESFLLSCMLTQNGDQDFFDLRPAEQLQLLDKSLNFHSINELSEIFKQASLARKSVAESVGSIHATLVRTHEASGVSAETLAGVAKRYEEACADLVATEDAYRGIPEAWAGAVGEDHLEMAEDEIDAMVARYDVGEDNNIDTLNQRKGVLMNAMEGLNDACDDADDADNATSYTQAQLDAAEGSLLRIERERDETFAQKPVVQKPAGGTDYAKWRQAYDAHMRDVTDAYGSVDALLEEAERLGNDGTFKPSLDRGALATYKESIRADRSKLLDVSWYDDPDDAFCERFVRVEARWEKASAVKEANDRAYDVLSEETREAKRCWVAAEDALGDHTRPGVAYPGKTEEECDAWLKSFGEMRDDIAKVRSRHDALGTYLRVKRDTDEIAGAHHPFNEHCWACQKQSWKLRLDEKENALEDAVGALRSVGMEQHEGYTEDALRDMRHVMDRFASMVGDLGFWEGCKDAWSAYAPYERTREALVEDVRACRARWESKEIEMEAFLKERRCVEGDWEDTRRAYEEACYCKEQRPRWKETTAMIERQDALWNDYERASATTEAAETTRVLSREHDEWNAWKAWKAKVVAVEREYETLGAARDRAKYHVCRMELREIDRRLNDMTQWAYWKRVADAKPAYDTKQTLRRRLEELKAGHAAVSQEYHAVKALHEVQQNSLRECVVYKQLFETLDGSRRAIDHVQGAFSGFRKWLYATKVLPRLLQETNRIVSQVTHADTLRLDVDVHQDGDKLAFSWFICDGFNRVPMEKASGFQRFIIGLGVRISLSYIGASFVRCQQLFIDEGFTACDKTHLLRVPEFIKNLLGIYETIVLVSHLDEIKDATRIQIPITREEGSSVVRFGAFLALDQKKKRGRRAKNVENVDTVSV